MVSGLVFPSAIVLDHELGAMYWLDQDAWMARAGFDGSGFEVLSDTVTHRGIDIDHVHGKVYWSTSDTRFVGRILRSDLDGSHVQIVVRSGMEEFKPNAIALDVAGGKIYLDRLRDRRRRPVPTWTGRGSRSCGPRGPTAEPAGDRPGPGPRQVVLGAGQRL